jgi:pimeloyl-ACP methyl ester carboxylesterase
MSNQGASGVLNESIQGDDRKCQARLADAGDILTSAMYDSELVRSFEGSAINGQLFPRRNASTDRRNCPQHGLCTAVRVGRSQVRDTKLTKISVNLSLIHPRLFSTLVLFEPVIQPEHAPGPNAAMMSTYRTDLWHSRKAAEAAFRRNKFFQTWDSRVLDKYIEFGLRKVPTALYPPKGGGVPQDAVTLTTSKHQEAWNYVRSNFEPQDECTDRLLSPDLDPRGQGQFHFTCAETTTTYTNLPSLRPSVLYVWGSSSDLTSPRWEVEKLRLTGTGVGGSGGVPAGKVQKVVIGGSGHLVPCEQVVACAGHAADWLERWVKRYRTEEEFYRNHNSKKSAQDKLVTSDEWKKRVRQPTTIIRPIKGKL